jgi:PAS domain S-box-containing protein
LSTKNYRSRGKARVLLNLLSDPAVIIDGKGNFLMVNDAFEDVTGLSWKELIETPFFKINLLTPESKVVLLENLKKRMQGAPVEPYEVCFADKLGEKRCVEVKGKNVSYAGQPASLAVFHDVTLRKENARRLKEYSERMEALVEEKVKEIQDKEEKYRKLFEESIDAIFVADTEMGIIVDCNRAASELVGRQKSELVGQHQSIITPQEQMDERFARVFKQHLKDQTKTLETQIIRKTGEIRDVAVRDTIFELKGKKLMQGTIRDITDLKKAEQTIKETEKRYHALFDRAPLGVLVIDPQTEKPVEFNDVAHTQLGYSREEFSKLCISDFEAKETADEISTRKAKMVREGGDELETKHRTKNGEIRNVLVTARVVELAGKPFLYCVFHDITEIRRVQDALMESESQYRQLVNVAQEGIWALDCNYRTVFVNPQITEMLGFAQSEMAGKSLFEFLDKKNNEQAKHFLEQSKQGAKRHFDCEFGRKDGSRVYASIAASVIYDDEGNPSGTLAMVSDITDRKVLEIKVNNYSKHLKSMVELRTAQLKDANERLVRSERLAAIGELAGMVGHDLRNPLAGIKNATYYLKKKGTAISEAQAKEILEIIDKAIDHSDKIINDLLDYSREMHLKLTECEPRTLLDEAVRMIRVPDRIQIVNHALGETRIRVDADKIMRVFINLIKNAVDAMPEKGTLEITSRQTRDNLEIAFADTGTGIPEETLPKIFSPLFTTKAQGMGFGLAICKRIIESHGGMITVKTAVNQGTTFTVTLPVKSKVEVGDEKTWINMPESLLSTTTRA